MQIEVGKEFWYRILIVDAETKLKRNTQKGDVQFATSN